MTENIKDDVSKAWRAYQEAGGQLDGITAVRFDPLSSLLGNQRWGHDPAVVVLFLQITIEPIAARPRFINKDEVLRFRLHLADELIKITLACANGAQIRHFSTVLLRDIGDSNRLLMDIHANEECGRLRHG